MHGGVRQALVIQGQLAPHGPEAWRTGRPLRRGVSSRPPIPAAGPGGSRLADSDQPRIAGRRKENLVELRDYIRIIRKRWRIIVAAMLVVLAGAALATALSPKVYEAQTRLFVSTAGGTDSRALLSGSSFTQQRVKSYTDVISNPKVRDPLIAKIGHQTTAEKKGLRLSFFKTSGVKSLSGAEYAGLCWLVMKTETGSLLSFIIGIRLTVFTTKV